MNVAAGIFIVGGLSYGAWALALAPGFAARALMVSCVAAALFYLGLSLLQRRPDARKSAFATAVVVALSNAVITGMLVADLGAAPGGPAIPVQARPGLMLQAVVALAFAVAAVALMLERRGERAGDVSE